MAIKWNTAMSVWNHSNFPGQPYFPANCKLILTGNSNELRKLEKMFYFYVHLKLPRLLSTSYNVNTSKHTCRTLWKFLLLQVVEITRQVSPDGDQRSTNIHTESESQFTMNSTNYSFTSSLISPRHIFQQSQLWEIKEECGIAKNLWN